MIITIVCIYVFCFKLMLQVSQSILKQLIWLGSQKLCVMILILNIDIDTSNNSNTCSFPPFSLTTFIG